MFFFFVGKKTHQSGVRPAAQSEKLPKPDKTDAKTEEKPMAKKHATRRLFDAARLSNLLRHTRKGSLVGHLARKFAINKVLKKLGL